MTVCEKRQAECGLRDEAYRARGVYDGTGNELAIERCKPAAVRNGERKQIAVCHLGRAEHIG